MKKESNIIVQEWKVCFFLKLMMCIIKDYVYNLFCFGLCVLLHSGY